MPASLDPMPTPTPLVVPTRAGTLPPDGAPPAPILDSWQRCHAAGLDPAMALSVPVVDGAELARRRDRLAFLRRLARAQLETLSRQIAGSNFLLAFADRDGVILDLYADNRFTMSGRDAGIVAGSVWREDTAGTNGLGTALATGGTVAVSGLEHYFLSLGEISCTAAPVRDAQGEIVGVLDASSYYLSRQRHTQALVQMAATHIENCLLVHQMRGRLVLAVHPRAEYLATLSAGLLAFDGQGRLEALNAHGRSLLAGLQARPGTRFEDLFGETYAGALARLQSGGEVRLRDALGSALVARIASATPVRLLRRASDHATEAAPPAGVAAATSAATPIVAPRPVPAFLAADPVVAAVCRTIEAAVRLRVPILIAGETGTGKELLARHAHVASGRSGAFVAVSCAALPAAALEAELFGHGADRRRVAGRLVAADGGTLLLDDVGALPPPLQAELLRFLDDPVVRPVAGDGWRRVDVQLLAVSAADLAGEVRAGRFREDLLFRLDTVRAALPPLRQRSDFAAAVRCTLAALDGGATIDDAALARLAAHAWPGNFHELRAVLARALLSVAAAGAPALLTRDAVERELPAPARTASALQQSAGDVVRREFERCRNVSQTARALGISRTTVYRYLRELGPG